jgi:hypothetical protein
LTEHVIINRHANSGSRQKEIPSERKLEILDIITHLCFDFESTTKNEIALTKYAGHSF